MVSVFDLVTYVQNLTRDQCGTSIQAHLDYLYVIPFFFMFATLLVAGKTSRKVANEVYPMALHKQGGRSSLTPVGGKLLAQTQISIRYCYRPARVNPIRKYLLPPYLDNMMDT